MNKRCVPIVGSLLILLAACGPTSSATAIPTVVLGTNQGSSTNSVTASGVIVPVREAHLSFPLTGVVRTVSVQVGDRVTAGQPLAALDSSVLEAEAKVADADLQAMQIQYKYLARTGTDQEHLDSALADVARAQALLEVAKATLAQASLLAPIDGTITSVDIAPGEVINSAQVAMTMGDLTHFRVETTDLGERDAPFVQIGQSAEVNVTALGQSFAGKVTDISRISSTLGGDVVYKVTVELDTQPSGLLWGMTTDVRISTGG